MSESTCLCGRPIVRIRRYNVGIVGDPKSTLYGVEWRKLKDGTWSFASLDGQRPIPPLDGTGTHYHLHCARWRDVGGLSRHETKAWLRDLGADLREVVR